MPAGSRTLIRHRDQRQITPNTPGRGVDERLTAQGRYFEADCLAADSVGDFVYITGTPVSGFYQVTQVDITDPSAMPAVGVIVEKSTSTRCFVQTEGLFFTSGLTPQARYWVGADSQISPSPPVSDIAQVIGIALSDTDLKLLIQNQSLDNLDAAEHRGLDQLVHEIAEDSFEEFTYVGNRVTAAIVWTDALKTDKIREELYTYTGNRITTIVTNQYSGDGSTIVETLTETLAYSGNRVTSITAVLT